MLSYFGRWKRGKKRKLVLKKKRKEKQALSVCLSSCPHYKLKCFESLSLSWSVFITGTFCRAVSLHQDLAELFCVSVGVVVHCPTHPLGSSEARPSANLLRMHSSLLCHWWRNKTALVSVWAPAGHRSSLSFLWPLPSGWDHPANSSSTQHFNYQLQTSAT